MSRVALKKQIGESKPVRSATLPGECAAAPNVRRLSAALDIPLAPLSVRNVIVKLPDASFNQPGQISLLRYAASRLVADVGLPDCVILSLWKVR